MDRLQLPPLFDGRPASDPYREARRRAATGADAGLLLHDGGDAARAALVLIPEVPLAEAAAMLPAGQLGLHDALGAVGPPELPLHLEWEGHLRVNGARCGHVSLAADTEEPGAVPNWLVLAIDVPFRWAETDPGTRPDTTVLHEEGCGDLSPAMLTEAWARHVLHWINRWEEDGAAPLHAEWERLSHEKGRTLTLRGRTGTFLGIDERMGALIRGSDTALIPLTELVEAS